MGRGCESVRGERCVGGRAEPGFLKKNKMMSIHHSMMLLMLGLGVRLAQAAIAADEITSLPGW